MTIFKHMTCPHIELDPKCAICICAKERMRRRAAAGMILPQAGKSRTVRANTRPGKVNYISSTELDQKILNQVRNKHSFTRNTKDTFQIITIVVAALLVICFGCMFAAAIFGVNP